MPGLVVKRSHEEMEAGSRGSGPTLQNPESVDGETPRKRQMLEAPNGDSNSSSLNHNDERAAAPHTNGSTTATATRDNQFPDPSSLLEQVSKNLPPELEKVPAESYTALSFLIDRLAEDTFQGLHDVVDELAQSSGYQANGAGGSGDQTLNTMRKTKLWNFAQDARAKFIKLLVLSQWSRNASSIAKLIDISNYLNNKLIPNYATAHEWMGALTTIVSAQDTPAPELGKTLQVLAEGKANWISSLGFIPDKPLSPQETLDALQHVNNILTVRMGLHQKPPDCLQHYEIHDGRVTFRVEDEFEVDFGVANDDPKWQLYFLDLRFLFSPGGGSLKDGPLYRAVQSRIDGTVGTRKSYSGDPTEPGLCRGTQGLTECYEFLHELSLTHKLKVLKAQAAQLRASRWGDNIKYEEVHRGLVVQYWTNRPGGKGKNHWIEIGVKKRPSPEQILEGARDTSFLSLRWHRHGKEVFDHAIELDPSELSLETILKDTIATHTNFIFTSVKKDLVQRHENEVNGTFKVKQRRSPIEPSECELDIGFPDDKHIKMIQEPVAGRFVLLPPSGLHSRCEVKLNSLFDPANECGQVIRRLRVDTAADRYARQVAMIGWTRVVVPRLGPQTRQTSFHKRDVQRIEYCRPPHWDKEWCLALTNHLSGYDIWHLVRLKADMDAPLSSNDKLLGREKSPFQSCIMICYDPSGCVTVDAKNSSGSHVWNIQSSVPLQTAFAASGQGNALVERNASATFRQNKYAFLFSLAAHGAAIATQIANEASCAELTSKYKPGKLYEFDEASPRIDLKRVVSRDDGGPDSFQNVSIASLRLGLGTTPITKNYQGNLKCFVAGVYSGDGTVVTITQAQLQHPVPVATQILRFPGGALIVSKGDSRQLAVQLSVKTGAPVIKKLFDCLISFSSMIVAAKYLQKQRFDISQVDFARIEASLETLNKSVIRKTSNGDDGGGDGDGSEKLSAAQLSVSFRRGSDASTKPGGGAVNIIEFDKSGPYARNQKSWQVEMQRSSIKTVANRIALVHQMVATVHEISKLDLPSQPFVVFRGTYSIRMIWGMDAKDTVELALSLCRTSGKRICWEGQFIQNIGEGHDASESIKKLQGIWQSEIAYKKGDGYEGLGAQVKIEPEFASATLWHIFNTLQPGITEFYESQRNDPQKEEREKKEEEGSKTVDKKKADEEDKKGKSKENSKAHAGKSQTITID